MKQKKDHFSTLGYIAAALGMCIGTGNVWRFPRICAAHGGGAFIVAWTVATLFFAVPLLSIEMAIGRKTRLGVVGSFRDYGGKKSTWLGLFVVGVCFFLMSYYCVVQGYCIKYTINSAVSFETNMTTATTAALWESFTGSPSQVILMHAIGMAAGCFVVYKGISGGIESFCKVMIPALFLILVGLAVYALTLDGASAGLQYLFTIDTKYLFSSDTWIQAFVQAAWSTGAGWGFITTYANYIDSKEDIPNSCLLMGLGDNLGALLAAIVVIPSICALSPSAQAATEALSQGNYGITFIYVYQLFSTIPGGRFISFIFFFLLSMAALTSMFSMIEVSVKALIDLGFSRQKGVLLVCGAGFLVGCFSAYNLANIDNQDWVWGLGLLISGALFSIVVIKNGVEKLRREEINSEGALFHFPKVYFNTCTYLMPVLVVVMVVWWLLQTRNWYPNTWLNPFVIQDNTGTVLLQLGILSFTSLFLNNTLNRKTSKGPASK
ncbi:MAG: sodium-dependent transporter [Erysipelotrichaceae bacterium]|nr:sodium-dependent transporter [Erysipelotrichaceae bacterium]